MKTYNIKITMLEEEDTGEPVNLERELENIMEAIEENQNVGETWQPVEVED